MDFSIFDIVLAYASNFQQLISFDYESSSVVKATI